MESDSLKEKSLFLKSDEGDFKTGKCKVLEDAEMDDEELTTDSCPSLINGSSPSRKHNSSKQMSEEQRSRGELEADVKHGNCVPQERKSVASVDLENGRSSRRSKQGLKSVEDNQEKSPSHSPTDEENGHVSQGEQDLNLTQPVRRRLRRNLARVHSPPKEENDNERVLRSLTRTRGCDTPPPIAIPFGKGTKRSKRVAQRLANEEPPPPPLKLPKLQVVLTKKEIHEDWLKITGHKYTGKPKKSTMTAKGLNLCTSLTCPSSIRYLNDP